MIAFPRCFFSPGDAGGSTAGDGGEGGTEGGGESWHGKHTFFQQTPEAVKAFAKYADENAAFKGAYDTMQKLGKPFRVPEAGTKLTAEQQAEFRTALGKFHGVPAAPEGYEFEVPADAPLDEQGMTEFRHLLHERGVDPQTAKDLLGIQLGLVDRLNQARLKIIQGMTHNNFKTFTEHDCQGNKDLALESTELVKQYLQTFCVTGDGKPDPKMWEGMCKRLLCDDRLIELPLLRALADAARLKVGTGGAPGSFGRAAATAGAFAYTEMDNKK